MSENFTDLGIKVELVKALREQGIVKPTTIQQKAIPLIYQGKDVVGISRTGSGKTASFGIPIIEKAKPGQGVQSLILAPTRELANQISNELRKWGKYMKVNVATVFGGVGMEPQVNAISNSEIVVGTPGRVLDHIGRGTLNLTKLNFFVLDEADKMVEMGFIEDIEEILKSTSKNRQIILFGATISKEINYLKQNYMKDVVEAEAELQVKKDLLEQYYYNVRNNEKFSLLVHLLKKEDTDRVIVFCSKRSTVDLVQQNLRLNGIKAEKIHGKMTQNKRLNVIERFNKDKASVLVASSVAARGLDIKDVTHVFNYDLAKDPQEYIHRVGRTARAGEAGKAITLLSHDNHEAFHAVLNKYPIDVQELPLEKFPTLSFQIQRRDNFRRNSFRNNRNAQRGRNNNYRRGQHNSQGEDLAKKYGLV